MNSYRGVVNGLVGHFSNGYYDDGPTTASFVIEIDNPLATAVSVPLPRLALASFQEVSGLSMEVEVLERNEGGENDYTHKLPGRVSYPNLTLKRGITQDNYFVTWFQESYEWIRKSGYLDKAVGGNGASRGAAMLAKKGMLPPAAQKALAAGQSDDVRPMERRTLGLVLMGANGNRLRTWNVYDAYVVSWSGPDFNVSQDEFPIEEIEIAHNGFEQTWF